MRHIGLKRGKSQNAPERTQIALLSTYRISLRYQDRGFCDVCLGGGGRKPWEENEIKKNYVINFSEKARVSLHHPL